MSNDRHPLEALNELVDDRLDATARAEVETHLAGCDQCRTELEVLRGTKRVASKLDESMPEGLEAQILAKIRAEDSGLKVVPAPADTKTAAADDNEYETPSSRRRWLWSAAAAAVAATFAVVFVRRPDETEHHGCHMPTSAARAFQAFEAGELELTYVSPEVDSIEAFFAYSSLDFETRVFDFGMMGIAPIGGLVHHLEANQSALFAYRDSQGRTIVCQMYRGLTSTLPEGAEIRENNGITFHVWDVEGMTTVFWQEGDVVCVLVGAMPRNEVVDLAFAKAMKV